MKKLTLLFIFLLGSMALFSQDITGTWNGILAVQGIELRVVFHIETSEEGYKGKMDSPDQNAYGLPLSSVEFKKPELIIKHNDLSIVYKGTLADGKNIKGTFTQNGQSFEMNLKKKEE